MDIDNILEAQRRRKLPKHVFLGGGEPNPKLMQSIQPAFVPFRPSGGVLQLLEARGDACVLGSPLSEAYQAAHLRGDYLNVHQ